MSLVALGAVTGWGWLLVFALLTYPPIYLPLFAGALWLCRFPKSRRLALVLQHAERRWLPDLLRAARGLPPAEHPADTREPRCPSE